MLTSIKMLGHKSDSAALSRQATSTAEFYDAAKLYDLTKDFDDKTKGGVDLPTSDLADRLAVVEWNMAYLDKWAKNLTKNQPGASVTAEWIGQGEVLEAPPNGKPPGKLPGKPKKPSGWPGPTRPKPCHPQPGKPCPAAPSNANHTASGGGDNWEW